MTTRMIVMDAADHLDPERLEADGYSQKNILKIDAKISRSADFDQWVRDNSVSGSWIDASKYVKELPADYRISGLRVGYIIDAHLLYIPDDMQYIHTKMAWT